jgi:uncharacterized protein
MNLDPYGYENRAGILFVSWNDMHGLCRAIVKAAAAFQPELILPIARGGLYAGTLISHMLRADVYPVRISRRVGDEVVHAEPQWLIEPPELVKGKRVLVVDEISSTGETLKLVKDKVSAMGALAVRSAVLYAHSWGTEIPDYIGLISDALIVNPWDREVLQDGELIPHPEYVGALAEQGQKVDEAFLIPSKEFQLAKGV